MRYQLQPGIPIEREVRRIADRQLRLAIGGLRDVGNRQSDQTVHAARRHVKKVRALLRLVAAGLGGGLRPIDRRLRTIARRLGPIADGESAIATLERLARDHPGELSSEAVAALRASLVRRELRIDERARREAVLPWSERALRFELPEIRHLELKRTGFRAVAPGLERTVRRSRRAMRRALARPTVHNYHRWRRRTKDHWLQMRLLRARCGNMLIDDERRLEALDGYLGEYQNCALILRVLAAGRSREATGCRRLLRRYQVELGANALAIARTVYRDTPRRLVKRVRLLWKSVKRARRAAGLRHIGPRRRGDPPTAADVVARRPALTSTGARRPVPLRPAPPPPSAAAGVPRASLSGRP